MSDLAAFEATFDPTSKVYKVYSVLKNRQWHCREHEYTHVQTTQIAGGAGIQGLQRGTRSRAGMEIESGNHFCVPCNRQTRQDRWTGHLRTAVPAPSMPESFALRAVNVLGNRDVVDNTDRPPNQLTVDHKLPMLRWNSETGKEQTAYNQMTDTDIKAKFQLLRASNGSVSHNLLKSRTCERCLRSGKRGTPFGIVFFYTGSEQWEPETHDDPSGCVGCGWYDLDTWRKALNDQLEGKSGHEES